MDEIESVGKKIATSEVRKRELIALGENAEKEGQIENAIAYFRMSEFFMHDGVSCKKKYCEKATRMFYDFYAHFFWHKLV